jgi:hypothetical protein
MELFDIVLLFLPGIALVVIGMKISSIFCPPTIPPLVTCGVWPRPPPEFGERDLQTTD